MSEFVSMHQHATAVHWLFLKNVIKSLELALVRKALEVSNVMIANLDTLVSNAVAKYVLE